MISSEKLLYNKNKLVVKFYFYFYLNLNFYKKKINIFFLGQFSIIYPKFFLNINNY
jgi:hypothetical protein